MKLLIYCYTPGKSPPSLVGKLDDPIKYKSTCLAASLPSEMAQTIKDCPRRISPAVKMFGTLVWNLPYSAL